MKKCNTYCTKKKDKKIKSSSNADKNSKDIDYLQVGFIAVNKNGNHAGYSLRSGFNYAILDDENGNRMEDSQFKMSWNNQITN